MILNINIYQKRAASVEYNMISLRSMKTYFLMKLIYFTPTHLHQKLPYWLDIFADVNLAPSMSFVEDPPSLT